MLGITHLIIIIARTTTKMVAVDGSSECNVHFGKWNCVDSSLTLLSSRRKAMSVLILDSGALVFG